MSDGRDFEQEEENQKQLAFNQQKYYNKVSYNIKKSTENHYSRMVLYELIKFCGLFSAVIPDTDKVLHAEGKRLVGIFIKSKLDEIDSQLFYEILGEGVQYEEGILKSSEVSPQ